MSEPKISIILNVHREQFIVLPALKSIDFCRRACQSINIDTEVVVVLDRPDPVTREIVDNWAVGRDGIRIQIQDFGDLGKSRNWGVQQASGKWVAFLDADDVWASDWLTKALANAEADDRKVVWHPEVNVYFGASSHIFCHSDMEEEDFAIEGLALRNFWTSLAFCRRSLVLEVPYRPVNRDLQIGYEDWSWNIDAIATGAIHKVVAGAVHGIRVKQHSVSQQMIRSACMPGPTDFFRKRLDLHSGKAARK